MKKLLTFILAVMMAATLAACGSKEPASGTLIEGKTIDDVFTAVDKKFEEKYGEGYGAVAMAEPIGEQFLADFLELDSSAYEEFAGSMSMSMTNSDAFFVIKAKEGKVEAVTQAVEKRIADLVTQYQYYPVNGSYDRAQAGEAYVKGNYVFCIVVGQFADMEEETPNFSEDVQMTKQVIDSMFNS